MPSATLLDHVALAFEHAFDGLDRYRGDLGGVHIGGGVDPGFWWGQIRYANGMTLELLEPADVSRDDFLRRFLDRSGPGPHHLTFKVPDIEKALARVESAGFRPARVNLAHETWKEVFLHPKQSHGIVVQLAQSADGPPREADDLPTPRAGASARLDEVVHLVSDLAAARELFEGVLDGVPEASGDGDGVRLAWPGAGRIRLVQPARGPERDWLGARIGRLHHLGFSHPAPDRIAGARAVADDCFEIAPEHNFGTRLRLRSTRES